MTEWERYKQLFTKYKKCLAIGCILQFLQQSTGINAVNQYGPQIIIDSGFEISYIENKE